MKNFVDAKWLKDNMKNENLIIIDVRYDLHNKAWGQNEYLKEHIKNAFFLDIDKDLAGKTEIHGGSRPLPNLLKFIGKIEKMGITKDSKIVLYDNNMVTAARAFWMFKYLGHEDVKILNGGYKAWLSEKGETSTIASISNEKSTYDYSINKSIYADINDVKKSIVNKNSILIECRSVDRYLGKNEMFYKKAGHIPTAKCIPSKEMLTSDNFIKEKERIEDKLNSIKTYNEIIFYCGSGINASLDFVTALEVGIPSKVYIGSFSDWFSYTENTIETKDERYIYD